MKVILFFAVVSVMCVCDAFGQLAHDVSVDSMVEAPYHATLGAPFPQHARIRNKGLNTETNARLVCVTRDPKGAIVYRDTFYFDSITSGEAINRNFTDFIPQTKGAFSLCFYTILAGDQDHSNDTVCGAVIVFFERDVQALSIAYPKLNDSIAVGSPFRLKAFFQNISVDDRYFSPLRCEIRNANSGSLVFRADTAIEAFDAESTISCLFPDRQGVFDTRTIPSGNYIAAAITRAKGDGDLSNDTAVTKFTIRQEHDIRADSAFGIYLRSILGVPVPIEARFTNRGLDEQSIQVRFSIYWEDKLQYRDTQFIAQLHRDSSAFVAFQYFTAGHIGQYSLCAEVLMPTDKELTNNIACTSYIETIQHDLSADAFLNLNPRISTALENPCIVHYRNRGMSDEKMATASLMIRDSIGAIVYHHSQTISNFSWSSTTDVTFAPFTPAGDGPYYYTATIGNMNDQFVDDDTVYGTAYSVKNNIEVLRVDFPKDGDTLPPSQGFIPIATFRNPGATEMQNIAAHIEIRSCDDTTLACMLDRDIAKLPPDSVIVTTPFPSSQLGYDTRSLKPGCYTIAAFADGSNPPDTAYSTFVIKVEPPKLGNRDFTSSFTARVAPNPASGNANLTLSLPADMCISLEVYDMMGREVLSRNFSKMREGAETIPLGLGNLSNGRYMVRVTGTSVITLPLTICR